MKIPFSPPYIDDDVIQEVTDALKSGWITTGPRVKLLEAEIAAYSRVEQALAVNSATSAMMLVLHWFGVTRGDEVIIPAYTYAATALAVLHVGAKPVMVDAGDDFNIDVRKIKRAITDKTKAIITVDYGGWPCDYDEITRLIKDPEVCEKFKAANTVQQSFGRMLLLSDAAHALGALYKQQPVSRYADVTVYSFHAVKNVTSAEGGIICLNLPASLDNKSVYDTLRLWSLNGQTKDAFTKLKAGEWQYDIVYPGFKMNMPDVLAAIGLAQFRKYANLLLPERNRVVEFYNAAFSVFSRAILPPFHRTACVSSNHLSPLRIKGIDEAARNEIIHRAGEKGVAINVHFIPLPMLTIFKDRSYDIADYPNSYALYANELSLPVYPQLGIAECQFIADTVKEAVMEVTGD